MILTFADDLTRDTWNGVKSKAARRIPKDLWPIREFLEPSGVSQVEAARRMNIPFQRLNAIVRGRRGVSADTALLLEALTHWDAEIWLTLQARWDLWHALKRRGHRPKIRALPKSA